MNFDKPTTGTQRTASGKGPLGQPVGGFAECSPVSTPPAHEAGRNRRAGGSKPPHQGERWRHVRTGREAVIVHRIDDHVITSIDGFYWPIDFFTQRWERVA